MARTASPARKINFPRRPDPRPPIVYSDNNSYGCIEGDFDLIPIDPDTILMLPSSYDSQSDLVFGPVWSEGDLAWKARKTCVIYEDVFKASSPHPRIAEYLGRDPWTALPLLKRPSGPSLKSFMLHHHQLIYTSPPGPASASSCRPRTEYLPLVYQWCLQLISALEFVHSHHVIFGHFDRSNIWLSSTLSMFLVGFTAASWPFYPSRIIPTLPFHPTLEIHRKYIRTSKKTDLFCYGNTIYEMMTTFWPGDGTGLPFKEREDMYIRSEFPSLEDQYLGAVVHKCWNYQYSDVREVKEAILRFLSEKGFEVDDDVLRDLKPMELFNGHMRESYPEEVSESTTEK